MPRNTQDGRPMAITTPLGKDQLLLIGFSGQEALSQLFTFHLETLAELTTTVAFDQLLGQKVTVRMELPAGPPRFYNGIVSRVVEGGQTEGFIEYSLEVVPQHWLLTRKLQSRIFQHLSVPEILAKVFDGLNVDFQVQGQFEPREYCVQYRETDFAFASRLMEEEGIYYYFTHSDGDHRMVVANVPEGHRDVPGPTEVIYETVEGGVRHEDRVDTWIKTQELRSGKTTLFDHSFQLPHKHLEADKNTLDSVLVGTIDHKLKLADNTKLELYEFPGDYAKRFDGIGGGGGEKPADLQKIFSDNKRTAALRMQEETTATLVIHGSSNCRQFTSGHKFTLTRHFNADGSYVLTAVFHQSSMDNFRSGGGEFSYSNTFTCIPLALPFRPARLTPRALIRGTQTAVVTGPSGDEIFTDKFGRVKVQFHWDRDGQNDADSSCWMRVATHWAGKQWGMVHLPRVGQEVVVDFLEGDPDRPIIVGSVYNADQMPPFDLPEKKTQSGIKTRSTPGGGPSNFNSIRFEDKKGSEQLYIHAERNEDIVVEASKTESVGGDETIKIGRDRAETVGRNQTITILNNDTLKVVATQSITVGFTQDVKVNLMRTTKIGINDFTEAGVLRFNKAGVVIGSQSGGIISQSAAMAMTEHTDGIFSIDGSVVSIAAKGLIAITAPLILLNGRPVLPIPAPI